MFFIFERLDLVIQWMQTNKNIFYILSSLLSCFFLWLFSWLLLKSSFFFSVFWTLSSSFLFCLDLFTTIISIRITKNINIKVQPTKAIPTFVPSEAISSDTHLLHWTEVMESSENPKNYKPLIYFFLYQFAPKLIFKWSLSPQ